MGLGHGQCTGEGMGGTWVAWMGDKWVVHGYSTYMYMGDIGSQPRVPSWVFMGVPQVHVPCILPKSYTLAA